MNDSNGADSGNENDLQNLEQLPDAQSLELLAEFERRRRVTIFFV